MDARMRACVRACVRRCAARRGMCVRVAWFAAFFVRPTPFLLWLYVIMCAAEQRRATCRPANADSAKMSFFSKCIFFVATVRDSISALHFFTDCLAIPIPPWSLGWRSAWRCTEPPFFGVICCPTMNCIELIMAGGVVRPCHGTMGLQPTSCERCPLSGEFPACQHYTDICI